MRKPAVILPTAYLLKLSSALFVLTCPQPITDILHPALFFLNVLLQQAACKALIISCNSRHNQGTVFVIFGKNSQISLRSTAAKSLLSLVFPFSQHNIFSFHQWASLNLGVGMAQLPCFDFIFFKDIRSNLQS